MPDSFPSPPVGRPPPPASASPSARSSAREGRTGEAGGGACSLALSLSRGSLDGATGGKEKGAPWTSPRPAFCLGAAPVPSDGFPKECQARRRSPPPSPARLSRSAKHRSAAGGGKLATLCSPPKCGGEGGAGAPARAAGRSAPPCKASLAPVGGAPVASLRVPRSCEACQARLAGLGAGLSAAGRRARPPPLPAAPQRASRAPLSQTTPTKTPSSRPLPSSTLRYLPLRRRRGEAALDEEDPRLNQTRRPPHRPSLHPRPPSPPHSGRRGRHARRCPAGGSGSRSAGEPKDGPKVTARPGAPSSSPPPPPPEPPARRALLCALLPPGRAPPASILGSAPACAPVSLPACLPGKRSGQRRAGERGTGTERSPGIGGCGCGG
ncbi:skin secretory protein xP2-like [Podarcis raffonei]|uniref:skin secretory protein xP2-like n=1 Tax=Podarcis raffonei TaxID=65483 RepID=UPI0023297F65|nr:skin secretory protein xP2-like [Podarcis raffonei]